MTCPMSGRSALQGEYTVEGKSAVSTYVKYAPKKIVQLNIKKQDLEFFEGVCPGFADGRFDYQLGDSLTRAVVRVDSQDFKNVFQSQSINNQNTVVALDHLEDPRNVGAVVRSAAFFGIKYLLVPTKRQALLTDVVVQTAQGGFALTTLVHTPNLSQAIEKLKSIGFWVYGADASGKAPLSELAQPNVKKIILLGNEGKGLSPKIRKNCDYLVSIPRVTGFDSLNVSVAAGIFFQHSQPVKIQK